MSESLPGYDDWLERDPADAPVICQHGVVAARCRRCHDDNDARYDARHEGDRE